MPRILPIPAEVFAYFRYDPETGIIKWKINNGVKNLKGKTAGHLNKEGYIEIRFKGKNYQGHRIAYALGRNTLDIPSALDHINRDRSDNRLENLRAATAQENSCNTSKRKNTTSKYKGVSWYRRYQKWQAHIRHNGKSRYLGMYATEEKAHAAYCKAAAELHGDFANFG
jgi:hypothetical protein